MELNEYRITANDGKTLMSFHCFLDEKLGVELYEQISKCIQMICKEATEQYGEKVLVLYEENEDRHKRMHTLAVRCEMTASALMSADEQAARLKTVFKKGAKIQFEFEQQIRYEEKWKLFYIG